MSGGVGRTEGACWSAGLRGQRVVEPGLQAPHAQRPWRHGDREQRLRVCWLGAFILYRGKIYL